MAINTVKVTANKIKNRENTISRIRLIIIVLVLFLLILFSMLSLVYMGGDFVITLDPNFSVKSGLIMYDQAELKQEKLKLYANGIDFMDNISVEWLPNDIDSSKGGAHNGENYIAYTFFIENTGEKEVDYWYEVYIEDVIKNVDEAIRIMIIRNKERKIYAKINEQTQKEEENTIIFHSKDIAILEKREKLNKNEVDKYTIVIWLEGDDPDCLDNIIGGEIKLKMRIIESHLEPGSDKK